MFRVEWPGIAQNRGSFADVIVQQSQVPNRHDAIIVKIANVKILSRADRTE